MDAWISHKICNASEESICVSKRLDIPFLPAVGMKFSFDGLPGKLVAILLVVAELEWSDPDILWIETEPSEIVGEALEAHAEQWEECGWEVDRC